MAAAPLVQSPTAAGDGEGGSTAGNNVGRVERLASGIVGGLLVAAGIRRRSYPGVALALLGGELVRRGASGHCVVYDALHVSTAAGGDPAEGSDAVPGATALAEATLPATSSWAWSRRSARRSSG